MKLSEIKLFEEPIETKNAEDVWAEGEGDAASYITSTVYYVKPAAKAGYFDVTYDDDNDQRKTYGTMTKQDLDSAFTPLRGNQKADAEGYLQYRSGDVYDAFKYQGDPVRVNLGAAGKDKDIVVLMNKGDYLLRQTSGDNFIYTVEKANYFDNGYVKKTS